MKKVYLTGITGTVAPYIKEVFLKEGYHVDDTHIRINHIKDNTNERGITTVSNQFYPSASI